MRTLRRHGIVLAVMAVLVAAGCSSSAPLKDMVGYVPPTSLPAQPKRTLVADGQDEVWSQLVDFLESSAFELDHIDETKSLLVARYSGNPEPYIDCGSIVTHQGGALDQISGSASVVALSYEIDEEPVVLNRVLNLDSRIIISLNDTPQGTVIKTDTTYVVTKIVDVTDGSGGVKEGSRETVSFEAGNRGEFSKGTACQPNGSLDLAVLQSLPNIVGSDEIDRAELTGEGFETADRVIQDENAAEVAARPQLETPADLEVVADNQTDAAADDFDGLDAAITPPPPPTNTTDDWVLPDQGLPTAALPTSQQSIASLETPAVDDEPPAPSQQQTEPAPLATDPSNDDSAQTAPQLETTQSAGLTSGTPQLTTSLSTATQSPATIVDETTKKLLASLKCGGDEWHFCDLVELTTPYRKRNIEQLFGLTINTTESFTSQIIGRDLKLDVLFPSFSSHLHVAYARRDGTIEHIMPSSEVWPADLAHQLAEEDTDIPGPAGLAMIIAIASKQPLFPTPPEGVEDATAYLNRLKQRLVELEGANPEGQIAASQLLIYVEKSET